MVITIIFFLSFYETSQVFVRANRVSFHIMSHATQKSSARVHLFYQFSKFLQFQRERVGLLTRFLTSFQLHFAIPTYNHLMLFICSRFIPSFADKIDFWHNPFSTNLAFKWFFLAMLAWDLNDITIFGAHIRECRRRQTLYDIARDRQRDGDGDNFKGFHVNENTLRIIYNLCCICMHFFLDDIN